MSVELVPEEAPFDQEEVRALLLELDGNVTAAAKTMGVDAERLRAYVRALPALRRAIDETMEEGVDLAIAVLYEALRDEKSLQNRFYAAKEFLRTAAARRRGFGHEPTAIEVKTDRPATITLKWLEPKEEEG